MCLPVFSTICPSLLPHTVLIAFLSISVSRLKTFLFTQSFTEYCVTCHHCLWSCNHLALYKFDYLFDYLLVLLLLLLLLIIITIVVIVVISVFTWRAMSWFVFFVVNLMKSCVPGSGRSSRQQSRLQWYQKPMSWESSLVQSVAISHVLVCRIHYLL